MRFSIWPRRRRDTASWNAVSVDWSMSSLLVASGPTMWKCRSVDGRERMRCGGRGWISPGSGSERARAGAGGEARGTASGVKRAIERR
jgi:hypothetical protein